MTKINEIILRSGQKKQFIARKLNISPATLSRYCKGKTYPNYKIIGKLAKILNVPVSEFFLLINNTNT